MASLKRGAHERFARLHHHGQARFASLEDGTAHLLSDAPWRGGVRTGEIVEDVDDEGRGAVVRLCPVVPSKIVCIGRNYGAHARELGNEVPKEPLLFLKPPSALIGPDATVELPPESLSTRVEHEAELGIVIGRRARRVSPKDACDVIFGATALLDVTARDLQRKDGQWTRAKGMDTFCPVGPVVVSGLDLQALSIECTVSGAVRQRGTTSDMVFPVTTIIAFISAVMTLEPGDLIATGTPAGVGPLQPGDTVSVTIGGIGTLAVRVDSSAS